MKILRLCLVVILVAFLFSNAKADNCHPELGEKVEGKRSLNYIIEMHHEMNHHIGNMSRECFLEHFYTMKSRNNVHVVSFNPETHTEEEINAILSEKLKNSEIKNFEKQVKKQLYKRSISFNDPGYSSQWHLHQPSHLADLSVENVWEQGFFGQGIVVSIVDDGIDHTHPDIAPNYLPLASYDVNYQDDDPESTTWEVHGTEAAGTAGAIRNNNVCGVGVAPAVSIAAIRLLSEQTEDWEEAEALQYRNDIVHIYSNSWGPYDDGVHIQGPGSLTLAAFENSTTNGRGGLGNIYIWAAGNGKAVYDNINYDGYANSRFSVTVGAIGYDGTSPYYSEPGAPLLICAPSSDGTHSIYTSANSGNCRSNFGGTSAACPMVVGVVALCLDANPSLTWRDVQGVLIESAEVTDPNHADWSYNGAGYHINHQYGFGKVNATAAVTRAASWTTFPPYRSHFSGNITVNTVVPDHTVITKTWTNSVSMVVEHVELIFTATILRRGHLKVTITSPAGTVSLLADQRNDSNQNYDAWLFTSMRYWGESAVGTWTVAVEDKISGITGTFNSFEIKLYGH